MKFLILLFLLLLTNCAGFDNCLSTNSGTFETKICHSHSEIIYIGGKILL